MNMLSSNFVVKTAENVPHKI